MQQRHRSTHGSCKRAAISPGTQLSKGEETEPFFSLPIADEQTHFSFLARGALVGHAAAHRQRAQAECRQG